MDKLSVISFFSVSVPEEFLFILITAFLIGRKDILKTRAGLVGVIIATLLTALCTVVLRRYSADMLTNIIGQTVLFVLIYVFILRMGKVEAFLGFSATLLYQFIIEIINVMIMAALTRVAFTEIYQNDMIRFLQSLPVRLLQLVAVIVLAKLPFTVLNFKVIKLTIKVRFTYLFIGLGAVLGIINITLVIKKDMLGTGIYQSIHNPFLWGNLLLTGTIILAIIGLIKDIQHEKREQVIKLLWVKDLLVECGGDIMKVNEKLDEKIKHLGGKL